MKQNNLNKIRIQKGKTQKDIADAVGMSRAHVQTIEYYKVSPNVHMALKIADYLGVDINELFFN
jgi:putative transcriptional regulator